jgi:hypothetical protein
MTCGGFLQFPWPEKVTPSSIGDNKKPEAEAVKALAKEAEKYARNLASGGLREKLEECADYLTLGIDSYKEKISMTQNQIRQPHIELVLVMRLKTGEIRWTGKSYPTPG